MNLILFLLLALTASRTGLVQCEEAKEETEEKTETIQNHGDVAGSGDGSNQGSGNHPLLKSFAIASMDLGSTPNSGSVDNEETSSTIGTDTDTDTDTDTVTGDLNLVIMIIIPLVLTLVIIAVIMCVVMMYRRGRMKVAGTKEDPYLDHEDHEKVPMPMFEDDIPSVMELEMEDLENWISKDGGKKVDTGQI